MKKERKTENRRMLLEIIKVVTVEIVRAVFSWLL